MTTDLTIYDTQIQSFKKSCEELSIDFEIIQELMEGNKYRLTYRLTNDLYYLGYLMSNRQAQEVLK